MQHREGRRTWRGAERQTITGLGETNTGGNERLEVESEGRTSVAHRTKSDELQMSLQRHRRSNPQTSEIWQTSFLQGIRNDCSK